MCNYDERCRGRRMNTPIVDFVKKYEDKNAVRLHMPGHKGKSFLGAENLDITESRVLMCVTPQTEL